MEKLLTVKDISKIFQMSPKTIRHWAQIGYIPHYKFRKELRFRIDEIARWQRKKQKNGRASYKLPVYL